MKILNFLFRKRNTSEQKQSEINMAIEKLDSLLRNTDRILKVVVTEKPLVKERKCKQCKSKLTGRSNRLFCETGSCQREFKKAYLKEYYRKNKSKK